MDKDSAYYRLAFKIFFDFTGITAVPAVLAALGGKWLDTRFHTAPRYVILLLLLAFLSTGILFVKKAKEYKVELDDLNKKL
ncbi:MAG: AtpZ/AtpI family protein [Patescibacteria group bacterium]